MIMLFRPISIGDTERGLYNKIIQTKGLGACMIEYLQKFVYKQFFVFVFTSNASSNYID